MQNGNAPYQLPREDWQARHDRANSILSGAVEGSKINALKELMWLGFDVIEEANEKLLAARCGKIEVSPWGSMRLMVKLKKPVTYGQVKMRAKRLGLI